MSSAIRFKFGSRFLRPKDAPASDIGGSLYQVAVPAAEKGSTSNSQPVLIVFNSQNEHGEDTRVDVLALSGFLYPPTKSDG